MFHPKIPTHRAIFLSVLAAFVVACLFESAPPAGAQEKWYPSKYGADDTLGAINNLSGKKQDDLAGSGAGTLLHK